MLRAMDTFAWWTPRVPPAWRARAAEAGRRALQRDVRERAALLGRLGRSRDEVLARCRQNLRWELEGLVPLDEPLRALPGWVDAALGRAERLVP